MAGQNAPRVFDPYATLDRRFPEIAEQARHGQEQTENQGVEQRELRHEPGAKRQGCADSQDEAAADPLDGLL
jgi:hypothetical protein